MSDLRSLCAVLENAMRELGSEQCARVAGMMATEAGRRELEMWLPEWAKGDECAGLPTVTNVVVQTHEESRAVGYLEGFNAAAGAAYGVTGRSRTCSCEDELESAFEAAR